MQLNKAHADIEGDRYRDQKQRRYIAELRKKVTAPQGASLQMDNLAALFGGGEHGRKAAAIILETQYDLDIGKLDPLIRSNPVKPGQGESNQPGDYNQSSPH